ncbi:MAG TPA: group II intron maturase-specific domain-containing protein [Polyangiaceae bacterium]|nr:group II intron maturase-specific domain-containing protein [Polyangiaceae bacterium]HOE48339.1 group II intron maturase-specific domain-containing protein [Polyangiaceae bacterium]HPK93503.1 group II intron maturase-specific domain-containing protein [Polyangiaceae bacterium]HPY17099.1 group II intron maturase-specific domain-containing protein [Polyangiaceae bacterium]HQF21822.1 group II intron maturase-specific domain-containing protein [Polyangiaceae bacterium]
MAELPGVGGLNFLHRLKFNRTKSAVARPEERTFLGNTITRCDDQPQLEVAAKSVQRLQAKLKPLFRQGREMKLANTNGRNNRIIRGWTAYFRLSWDKNSFRQPDGWIRRHLRSIQWRRWKSPRTRLRRLLEIGGVGSGDR